MRGPVAVLVLSVACLFGPANARADTGASPLSQVTLHADLGYAYPSGTAEAGTDTRDVSFGLVPLSLIGTYDVARDWSARARVRDALNIPTLCASAPDCESSLGHDFSVSVGIGRAFPRWWHLTTHLALEAGWEWLMTKLSDTGVAASRSWSGPFARLEIFADLKSSGPWSMGPVIGVDVGLFSHFHLDTPAGHTSGPTDGATHAWPTISFRVGRRL
jgi:hypothetical protein